MQGSVLDRPNASAKRFGCHRERSMTTRDMPWLQLHGGHPGTCRYGDDPVDALYGLQSQDVACRVLRVGISRRRCRSSEQSPSGQVPPLAARWSRPVPTETPQAPRRFKGAPLGGTPSPKASRIPRRGRPFGLDATAITTHSGRCLPRGGGPPGTWRKTPWPRLSTTMSWSVTTA